MTADAIRKMANEAAEEIMRLPAWNLMVSGIPSPRAEIVGIIVRHVMAMLTEAEVAVAFRGGRR